MSVITQRSTLPRSARAWRRAQLNRRRLVGDVDRLRELARSRDINVARPAASGGRSCRSPPTPFPLAWRHNPRGGTRVDPAGTKFPGAWVGESASVPPRATRVRRASRRGCPGRGTRGRVRPEPRQPHQVSTGGAAPFEPWAARSPRRRRAAVVVSPRCRRPRDVSFRRHPSAGRDTAHCESGTVSQPHPWSPWVAPAIVTLDQCYGRRRWSRGTATIPRRQGTGHG
jgi:hypothetical protein